MITSLVLTTPLRTAAMELFSSDPDSRLLLASWVRQHLPRDCMLLVPVEVQIKPGTFRKHCRIENFHMDPDNAESAMESVLARWSGHPNAYLVFPEWSARGGRRGNRALMRIYTNAFTRLKPPPPVFHAGKTQIWADRDYVEGGNPSIGLYKLPF